jgi:hypothetical protein
MLDATTSGFRRSVTTTIATGALTVVAAGLTLATAGPASAAETAVSQKWTVQGLDSIQVSIRCPADMPYLKDQPFNQGRLVLGGIEVVEDGGIGVTMTSPYVGMLGKERGKYGNEYENERVVGAYGTATNWNGYPLGVTIIAHCTSVRKDGKEAVLFE